MQIDAEELQTNKTDDRGRFYLGTEYSNKRVTVAIVDTESNDPPQEDIAEAYREASASARSLTEEWEGTSDEAWTTLHE
jgi:hypothetical protein